MVRQARLRTADLSSLKMCSNFMCITSEKKIHLYSSRFSLIYEL